MSLNTKTSLFWTWFEKNDSMIRQMIDNNQYGEVNQLMINQLIQVLPEVTFEISRKSQDQYVLELLPMFDDFLRIAYRIFIQKAPSSLTKHWIFNYTRTPKAGILNLGNTTINGTEVIIFPIFDKKTNKIKCKVVCEKLTAYKDEERNQIVVLLFYEHLGEIITENCISSIEIIGKLSYNVRYQHYTSVTLSELSQHIEKIYGSSFIDHLIQQGLIYTPYVVNKEQQKLTGIKNGSTALPLLHTQDPTELQQRLTNIGLMAEKIQIASMGIEKDLSIWKKEVVKYLTNDQCLVGWGSGKDLLEFEIISCIDNAFGIDKIKRINDKILITSQDYFNRKGHYESIH